MLIIVIIVFCDVFKMDFNVFKPTDSRSCPSNKSFSTSSSGLGGFRHPRESSIIRGSRSWSPIKNRGSNSFRPPSSTPCTNHNSTQIIGHQNNIIGPTHAMSFKKLLALSKIASSEHLIIELLNSGLAYWDAINSIIVTDDTVVLLVKILHKVCESPFLDSKCKILNTSLKDSFVNALKKYMACLPMQDEKQQQKNNYFWENVDEFWSNVIDIFENVTDNTPTFASNTLYSIVNALKFYIPLFEQVHNINISDQIKIKVHKLVNVLEELKWKKTDYPVEEVQVFNTLIDEDPPDDFRKISVYPTALEIIGGQGFLRSNIIKGAYKDVDHYLDVQFRLLREDFVGPLRDGIIFYRFAPNKKPEGVQFHKNVKFLNPETVNEHYSYRVQLEDFRISSNFNYESCRRLMFGSLICFTNNNFQTLMFAKVTGRDFADLSKGQVIVSFDEKVDISFNTDYLMIESGVYFEPYYHVLNVLKKITPEDFPMERYLIKVSKDTRPPKYLLDPDCKITIDGQEISPLTDWPDTKLYNLNKSQLLAFKAAITQEFTVIQGPPGTGKTFIGLKIAQTLLQNKNIWYKGTPLLVVCFTNHALDQFLAGILKFTNRIMRVGGQSKSEVLKQYNLKSFSRLRMSGSVYKMKRILRDTLNEVASITENIKQINSYNTVRSFSTFVDVVQNFETSWFYNARKSQILFWLFEEVDYLENSADLSLENDESTEKFDCDSDLSQSVDEMSLNGSIPDNDEYFDEIFEGVRVQGSAPLISLSAIKNKLLITEQTLEDLKKIDEEEATEEQLNQKAELIIHQLRYRKELYYLQKKLAEGKSKQNDFQVPKNTDLVDPHEIPFADRWILYFYWLKLYKNKLTERLLSLKEQLRETYKVYGDMRKMENAKSMKDVLVVGMTTTSAARLRSSLQILQSPIVIVEEAAEVLEAHIVASVTKHCKQLILIGDHQQLQPVTADYNLNKQYNLGISLFERMVRNDIHCYTLNVQHRMRPEISALISPTIYPLLEDHPSVKERPNVNGIDSNLYFINHTNREQTCRATSKQNYYEVSFLLSLANHLVLNGYKPENITILTLYLGQMFLFQKERKAFPALLGVRIAVLDNYQGEECDIILLSLVRNNSSKDIGFLSTQNRICVALSRAKCGLYIMGNMNLLASQNEVWAKVKKTLEEQNAIGAELPLRCQVHPEVLTFVKTASDFLTVSEGGCYKKCGAVLECGHKCPSVCHTTRLDHKDFVCRQKCERTCNVDKGHRCLNMCFQKCEPCDYTITKILECGHNISLKCHLFNNLNMSRYICKVPVTMQLPCGHECVNKPCHVKVSEITCESLCEKVLPCGHPCRLQCHFNTDPYHLKYKCRKRCVSASASTEQKITSESKNKKQTTNIVKLQADFSGDICINRDISTIPVEKARVKYHVNGHNYAESHNNCIIPTKKPKIICPHLTDADVDQGNIYCEKPCEKVLKCGHRCNNKCSDPCEIECEIMVSKIFESCGHSISVKCCESAIRDSCQEKCNKMLNCGHQCTAKCSEKCIVKCKHMVDCSILSPCGHFIMKITCDTFSNDNYKNSNVIFKFCTSPCKSTLKCGHICSGNCNECNQNRFHKKCVKECTKTLVCGHKCVSVCSEICKPCNKPCLYKCQHAVCDKNCGEICNVCEEECPRRCPHKKCSKRCGEMCDVSPCKEKCDNVLDCGHKCVGFCGDPCVVKCADCNKIELLKIASKTEIEDLRFVLLNDCNHIVESVEFERYLARNNEVGLKCCSICGTPLITTHRYKEYIIEAFADIQEVKLKLLSGRKVAEIEDKKLDLEFMLFIVDSDCLILAPHFPKLKHFYDRLEAILKNPLQPDVKLYHLNIYKNKIKILQRIVKICSSIKTKDKLLPYVDFLSKILLSDFNYLSAQEIEDMNCELNRFERIVDLIKIKSVPNFSRINKVIQNLIAKAESCLFSSKPFSNHENDKATSFLKMLTVSMETEMAFSTSDIQIFETPGFQHGQWLKCPRDHIFSKNKLCKECEI